jgi:hypothetical protein
MNAALAPPPTRAPPPVPFPRDNIPDVDTIISRLKALRAEFQEAAKAGFSADDVPPKDTDGSWWKPYPPPPELSLLSGDEPDEIREEVEKLLEEHLREDFYTPPGSPEAQKIVSGLEVVVKEEETANTSPTISVHSSSGEQGPAETGVGTHGGGSLRNKLSVLHLRRGSAVTARSSDSVSSADSTSLAPSSSNTARKSVVPTQRTVKHGITTAGVLLHSPYYTASMPNGSRPEIPQLVSPRAEAIKKYLKSRKEQRYAYTLVCLLFPLADFESANAHPALRTTV